MKHHHGHYPVVQKEEIDSLTFPKKDVLHLHDEVEHRHTILERAMKLGNNHKHKVKIVFEDSEGIKMVETTIWAIMEKSISLKGSAHIPISRIHDIIMQPRPNTILPEFHKILKYNGTLMKQIAMIFTDKS